MQNPLYLLNIDMIANYIAIVAAIWTSGVLFERWRNDGDPLTASLSFTFILQAVGLFAVALAEVYREVILNNLLVEFFSFMFSASFFISFIPMAYFYGGLFQPRNKWYMPLIGFLVGNATMLNLLAGEYYDPPVEVYLFLFILTVIVFGPMAYSCFKTAPMASRFATKVKFWMVGLWGLLYMFSYIIIIVLTFSFQSEFIIVAAYTIGGVLITGAYVCAWLGWVMPDWFRNRINRSPTTQD